MSRFGNRLEFREQYNLEDDYHYDDLRRKELKQQLDCIFHARYSRDLRYSEAERFVDFYEELNIADDANQHYFYKQCCKFLDVEPRTDIQRSSKMMQTAIAQIHKGM